MEELRQSGSSGASGGALSAAAVTAAASPENEESLMSTPVKQRLLVTDVPGATKVRSTVSLGKALSGSKEHGKMIKEKVERKVLLERRKKSPPDEKSLEARKLRAAPTNSPHPKVEPIQTVVDEILGEGHAGEEETATAVDIVARAVMENRKCPEVQEYCGWVLYDLARKDSFNRDVIVKSGALDGIIQSLADAPSRVVLQERGCGIIWLMALDEKHRAAIVKSNASSRLVHAIKCHKDVESVVTAAFGAMKPLSIDKDGRLALEQLDAASAVAFAMMANSKSVRRQCEGCSVLSNLAVDLVRKRVTVATQEEINAILECMMEHPCEGSVQKQACFALKNFSFSDRNLESLALYELPVDELLDNAAKAFQECRGDAELVLHRLSKFRSDHAPDKGKLDGLPACQKTSSEEAFPVTTGPQKSKNEGMALDDELLKNAVQCGKRGEYESALSQFAVSLKMKKRIYGSDAANNDLVFVLNCIGYVRALTGDFVGAIERYKESLTMQERIWNIRGANARDVAVSLATTMTTIGMLYIRCSQFDQAEHFLVRALDTKRDNLGSNTVNTAKDLENLGDLNRIRGKYEEAEQFYIKSTKCYESFEANGVERDLSNVISKLAALAGVCGQNEVAQRRFELALHLKKRAYGPVVINVELVNALNNLGYTSALSGNDMDAIRAYEESVEMQRSLLGKNNADENMVHTLTSLGVLYLKSGEPKTTRKYLEEALSMKREIDGEETSNDFLRILRNLGEACSLEEDWENAEVYYNEALQQVSQKQDSTKEFADILVTLGNIASERGDFTAAHDYFSKALDAAKVNGSHAVNNDLVEVLNGLGYVCTILRNYAVAIDKYELSLKMQQNLRGPNAIGEDMANTLSSLGVLYLERQSYGAAKKYLTEALAMKKHIRGENGMDAGIARILRNLGDVHRLRHEFEDAEKCYEEALGMLDQVTELTVANVAEMASIRMELGNLVGMRGDVPSAQEHFREALEMKKIIYQPGAMNLDLVEALNKLGYAYAIHGDYHDAIVQYEESLGMQQQVYGSDTENSNIADTLTTLEVLWEKC